MQNGIAGNDNRENGHGLNITVADEPTDASSPPCARRKRTTAHRALLNRPLLNTDPVTTAPAPSPVTAASPSRWIGVAALVAAGSGAVIALQGQLNGGLTSAGAGAILAGWFSYVGTLVTTIVIIAVRRRTAWTWEILRTRASWWWFAIGLCGIPIVLAMSAGIPIVGVAIASVCAVAGQTVAGLALDARGVGVDAPIRLTGQRLLAGLAALAGLAIAASGGSATSGNIVQSILLALALFAGGAILCGQQAGNGRVTALTGDPVLAGLTSVVGGTVGITLVAAVAALFGSFDGVTLPGLDQWWLYLGGPLGAIITIAAAWAVRSLGTFVLTLTVVCGQMVMALVLDLIGTVGLQWQTVAATLAVGAATLLVVAKRRERS